MAKSSATFSKKENEKKKIQKRKEKEQKREERKADKKPKSFEDMLAYIDENGNITSTPPDPMKKRAMSETEIDLTSRNKRGATPSNRHAGVVKFFDEAKGYGFIKDDRTSNEVFFHFKSADFQIAQSDRVNFDLESGPKGLQAARISKA